MSTGYSMKSGGSSLFGTSSDKIHDPFAIRWFEQLADAMDKRVDKYINQHGEPDDLSVLNCRKDGSLGLQVDCIVTKRLGFSYNFHLTANKYKYEQWAREHLYLMEGYVSFRVGPVIVAHPGRDPKGMVVAGVRKASPINIWEVEFGFLDKDNVSWFNLLQGTIIINAQKALPSEAQSSWILTRLR